ncbi:MAG: hypothetical protein ABEJ82_01825 [Haloplanus sp.]
MASRSRAQLVLVAAGVVAVALAPVVLAYLQLGYQADVRASADYDAPAANAERFLSRAVHEVGTNVTGEYDWTARDRAIDATRDALAPHLDRLRTARLARGTAYAVDYDEAAATDWASAACPGGPARQFGPCEARRGVVVQERAGTTHVLAVALDVRVTTDRGRTEVTLLVRPVGGAARSPQPTPSPP